MLPPLRHAVGLGLSPALIVASTHRFSHSWESLAAMVERDAPGLGLFFSGATPSGPHCLSTPEDYQAYDRAPRFFETQAWLKKHAAPHTGRWIAIDDSANLYGGAGHLPAQLILCQGHIGFGLLQAQELHARFDAIALKD